MKKNFKQPEYNPKNLINFRRHNLWMNGVEPGKPAVKFGPVEIVLLMILIMGIIVALDYLGIIQVAKTSGL